MKEIKEVLVKLINADFGGNVEISDFSTPPNPEMGDISLACFDIAREMKRPAQEAAREIAERINKSGEDIIEQVEAFGPYVNFHIKSGYLCRLALTQKFKRQKSAGEKVMIEYSQPNTHKEFHVGHLRNACLGAAVVNLRRFCGEKISAATYVNDIGNHVAKCLWNLMKFHKKEPLPRNKGQYLGRIYSEAVKRIEANDEFRKEVSDVQKGLEAGVFKLKIIWRRTRDWSVSEFKDIYKLLGIKFNHWYFESALSRKAKKIVEDLLKRGIARKSRGAVIIDLSKYGLDILVILKSDGNVLYSTSDLALAREKFKKGIDESVYVVDARQTLYFKQLFKTLELAGFKAKMTHVPYEFVTLPEGSFSSRQGNAVSFESFYGAMFDRTQKETAARHKSWPKLKIKRVAQKIALAAIKFFMLKYDNNSVIVFDVAKALSFDGDSGPYLLYALARVNSILKQARLGRKSKIKYDILSTAEERALIALLLKFDEIVEKSAESNSPHFLGAYLIELAQKFSNFYHQCPVLKAESNLRRARLVLCRQVKDAMVSGLKLLNIKPLKEM